MGFLSRLRGAERKEVALSDVLNPMLRMLLGYRESRSGRSINWETALEVTTVLACVQVLANGVSQVPWKVYRSGPGGQGSVPAKEHPLYRVLYRRPNPWQTSFQFRQTLVFHRALTGNAFVFVNRVNGEVRELIPIEPGRVEVKRNRDLSLRYTVTSDRGARQEFPQSAVWHLRGPSWNSWLGLEPVKLAREAIDLALATESAHADLHRNGVQTTGIYSVEGNLNEQQYTQLSAWIHKHIGGDNRFKPMVLDRKGTWQPITMTGVDAQHVETRRHQIEQLCSAFNVRPIMIGFPADMAARAAVESLSIMHAVHTIGPWHEDIDQSADVNLIGEDEEVFTKLNTKALMRADDAGRSTYYSKALGSGGSDGWMTPNEIRALEDMNPIEGGDVLPRRQEKGPAEAPPAKEPD